MKCSWMSHTHLLRNSGATHLSKNVLKLNQNKKSQETLGQTVISTDMRQEKMEVFGHNSI